VCVCVCVCVCVSACVCVCLCERVCVCVCGVCVYGVRVHVFVTSSVLVVMGFRSCTLRCSVQTLEAA